MKVLLKKVRIVCPQSPFHGRQEDILIENHIIKHIGDISETSDVVIESPDLHVSTGWFDMGAKLGDPGLEHKEDVHSGLKAALYGGYTGVACLPNTKPVIQSKENIHYLLSKSKGNPVSLHVVAAASEGLEGKSMTELFDLYHAGAVAFSDGSHPISNSSLMVRLLQYLSQLGLLLIVHSEEKSLTSGAVMNEGRVSVYLGLKGMPSLAEELMVSRNLSLLEYAGGRLHFSKISSGGSVEKIREAKRKGLTVTCDVAVANLIFDDETLVDFNTNYKTNPPLRTAEDKEALWQGVIDGTIDVIITDHDPQDEESKNLEFDLAEFGMIQLETAFPLLNETCAKRLPLDVLISKITDNPRKLLGLDLPSIDIGAKANLTVFDTEYKWDYKQERGKSKSKNSPVFDRSLLGRALAIYNNEQFVDLRN